MFGIDDQSRAFSAHEFYAPDPGPLAQAVTLRALGAVTTMKPGALSQAVTLRALGAPLAKFNFTAAASTDKECNLPRARRHRVRTTDQYSQNQSCRRRE